MRHTAIFTVVFVGVCLSLGFIEARADCPDLTTFEQTLASGDLSRADSILEDLKSTLEAGSPEYTTLDSLQKEVADIAAYVAANGERPAVEIQSLVEARLGQADAHDATKVGRTAYDLYARAADSAESGDWVAALKLIRIARFFQLQHLQVHSRTVRQGYERARELLDNRDAQSASKVLDSLGEIPDNALHYGNLGDQVAQLRQRVDAALNDECKNEVLWKGEEERRVRFAVYVGIIGLRQPSADVIELTDHPTGDGEWNRNSISPEVRPGFSGGVRYGPTKRLLLGASMNLYRFEYSTTLSDGGIALDLKAHHFAIEGNLQYLLRSKVGLRPYLTAGGGITHYSHDATEYAALVDNPDPPNVPLIGRYPIAARSETSGMASGGFGTHFVPSTDGWLAVSTELVWYGFFKDGGALRRPTLSFALRMELLL